MFWPYIFSEFLGSPIKGRVKRKNTSAMQKTIHCPLRTFGALGALRSFRSFRSLRSLRWFGTFRAFGSFGSFRAFGSFGWLRSFRAFGSSICQNYGLRAKEPEIRGQRSEIRPPHQRRTRMSSLNTFFDDWTKKCIDILCISISLFCFFCSSLS